MRLSALGSSLERRVLLKKLYNKYSCIRITKPSAARKCFACHKMETDAEERKASTRNESAIHSLADENQCHGNDNLLDKTLRSDKKNENNCVETSHANVKIKDKIKDECSSEVHEKIEDGEYIGSNSNNGDVTKEDPEILNRDAQDGIKISAQCRGGSGKPTEIIDSYQTRKILSMNTKHYPDGTAKKLLRERRDKTLESMMRKDAHGLSNAYKALAPIKTDRLPELRSGHGGAKPVPLRQAVQQGEHLSNIVGKRTLDRQRVRISREIAQLDTLQEQTNSTAAETVPLTDVGKLEKDDAPEQTARSSLILKIKERKLRSETKKEMQLRRRKLPRMTDIEKFNLDLSGANYTSKRPLPKLQSFKRNTQSSSTSEEEREGIDSKHRTKESIETQNKHKHARKHVSFGPVCILNIDEEFAMFVQASTANIRPYQNAFRAKLRRHQATDRTNDVLGFPAPLSPVRKLTKSTTTDKTFSSDKRSVPQFTSKPVLTLPKIVNDKSVDKETVVGGRQGQVASAGDNKIEKKPSKSILKFSNYHQPDLSLTVNCSPEFKKIMDSLHGIKPSPFLLK